MAKAPVTAKVVDTTTHEARIAQLEADNTQLATNLEAVDMARVALEERVEKLEAWIANAPNVPATAQQEGHGADSMGLPRVAGPASA